MPKKVEITPEVRAVLESATTDGCLVRLPDRQLERPLYQAVDKVLRALGGEWSRSSRAHRFPDDAAARLNQALENGEAVDQKRTLDQFFTPDAIAARVVQMAAVEKGMRVLEPSAGEGALVKEIVAAGANVWAYEIDPRLRDVLRERFYSQFGSGGLAPDFMAAPAHAHFDRVIMNPPFSSGTDMAHVEHALAFLRPGGRLVAIMSPHWTFATSAKAQAFRGLINEHSYTWEPLPDNSFRSSGTDVATGILTIQKGDI